MRRVEILSPAKINLHLEVGAVRNDGFHEIQSLFQAVSLYDRMEWTLTDRQGECLISGDFPCLAEDNLIYKAVGLFRDATGFKEGVSVSVDKKIPHEAGLGGGSSNGAAALKAMAALSGISFSFEKMVEMAASLGSDVPFFFYGAAAAVSGRGEIVETIPARTDFSVILVKPDSLGISTADAYRAVDRYLEDENNVQSVLTKEDMIKLYRELSPAEWPFRNSFFETYKNQYKPLEFIFNLLYDSGAVFAGLSGSGSAVFGLFLSVEKAHIAESHLRSHFPFTERIKPLDSILPANVL